MYYPSELKKLANQNFPKIFTTRVLSSRNQHQHCRRRRRRRRRRRQLPRR